MIINCLTCNAEFNVTESYYNHRIKKGYDVKFCSRKCCGKSRDASVSLACLNCGKEYDGKSWKHSKFCSMNCSGVYNNKHKKSGYRVSKVERWLRDELTKLYPELPMKFNTRQIIDLELDIYIPSLKIAFEINGIHHYKPIYGITQFQKVQYRDKCKVQRCLDLNIDLHVIDISSQRVFNEETSVTYLQQITEVIGGPGGAVC